MNRTSSTRSILDPIALLAGAALTSVILTASGCGSIGEGPKGPDTNERGVGGASDDPDDDDGGGGKDDDKDDNGGDSGGTTGGTNGDDKLPLDAPCAEIAQNAKAVLKTNCTSCHGANSEAKGGFGNVLDAKDLVLSGKVVSSKPDQSPLYVRMSAGTMPPPAETVRPSAKDLKTVRDWILCEAPDWDDTTPAAAYLSVDARLRLMLDDLRSLSEATRRRTRYMDLSNLANAGFSAAQLDEYREGVTILLNSLSYGAVVVPTTTIDPSKLLYRIDLRDYGWDDANWDQITEDYPYLVQYDQNSSLFPYDEVTAEQIRLETGTIAPYIQADWFIAHASQGQLYYDIIGFSGLTLNEIAASFGVNIQDNIENEEVARAGFTNSGVSVNNRIMERHELPGRQGAFWLSYDFADNLGDSNIQANPLDFVAAGGEAIISLPNGMQAYLIVDAAGNVLDRVPNNIATDPQSRTREVLGAASCFSCHNPNGIIQKDDTLRDLPGLDPDDKEAVADLYPRVADMQALITADQDRYKRARTTAGVVKFDGSSMPRMVNGHEGLLSLSMVAAVMGVTKAELEQALDDNADGFPAELETLRQSGGTISRSGFEDIFEGILDGLGLGERLVVNNVQ